MKKKNYENPESELLFIRFEEAVLGPSNPSGLEDSTEKDPFGDGWDDGDNN